jgi:flagellar hook-basal body complex protein FliE
MTDIDVNQLMVQMRAMAATAQTGAATPAVEAAQGGGFGDLLKQSIDQVNAAQAHGRSCPMPSSRVNRMSISPR